MTVNGSAKTAADLPVTADRLGSGGSLSYSYASPGASAAPHDHAVVVLQRYDPTRDGHAPRRLQPTDRPGE